MRVVYSPRASRDLEQIGAYYRTVADATIATDIAERIEYVIIRLGRQPLSAPRVVGRPDVRVALVLRYPYKIFYRVRSDNVEILHIRHTARRPWSEAGRS
jgi:plasmid stabilization system protein ParE